MKHRVKVEFIKYYEDVTQAQAVTMATQILPYDTHSIRTECWTLKDTIKPIAPIVVPTITQVPDAPTKPLPVRPEPDAHM